jgi:hypothetical protein
MFPLLQYQTTQTEQLCTRSCSNKQHLHSDKPLPEDACHMRRRTHAEQHMHSDKPLPTTTHFLTQMRTSPRTHQHTHRHTETRTTTRRHHTPEASGEHIKTHLLSASQKPGRSPPQESTPLHPRLAYRRLPSPCPAIFAASTHQFEVTIMPQARWIRASAQCCSMVL